VVESAAVNGNGKWRIRSGWSEVMVRVWVVGLAIVAGGAVCDEVAWGRRNGGQEEHVTTVRGRVLNKVTKEPIGRALVTTVGEEYAVMTDDRGQFEMKIEEQVDQGQGAGNFAGSRPTVGNLMPTFSGTRAADFHSTIIRSAHSTSETKIAGLPNLAPH
jgi:hypothetical protein